MENNCSPMFQRVTERLIKAGVPHEFIRHERPIRTAQDGADALEVPLGCIAPVLLLYADQKPFIVIKPGDQQIDFKAMKGQLSCRKLRFASSEEVKATVGFEIGNIPLVQIEIHLPVIVASELSSSDWVYGGSGDPRVSLKIRYEELIRINAARVLAICKPKRQDQLATS